MDKVDLIEKMQVLADRLKAAGALVKDSDLKNELKEMNMLDFYNQIANYLKEKGIDIEYATSENNLSELVFDLDEKDGEIDLSREEIGSSFEGLGFHLKEIGKIKMLTREEEIELSKKALDNDVEARNRLVEANLRLVVSIAKKYSNRGFTLGQAISAGQLGLIEAAAKYDYRKGAKFSTYASFWIKREIFKEIKEMGGTIRFPDNQLELMRKYEKVCNDCRNEGVDITDSIIAKKMNVSVDKIFQIKSNIELRTLFSLNASIGDEDDAEFVDSVKSNEKTPEERVIENDELKKYTAEVLGLDEIETIIFKMVCEEGSALRRGAKRKYYEVYCQNYKENAEEEFSYNMFDNYFTSMQKKVAEYNISNGKDVGKRYLSDKEYEECFKIKYSFYALIRRIFNWFQQNEDKNLEIKQGFESFKTIFATNKNNPSFNYKSMPMFFSEEFIIDTWFLLAEKVKNGYKNKSMAQNRGIYEKIKIKRDEIENIAREEERDVFEVAREMGLAKYEDNKFFSIFVNPLMTNPVTKKYHDLVFTNNGLEIEKKRIVEEFLEKWFLTPEICEKVIDEVFERDFFVRKIVPITKDAQNQIAINNQVLDYVVCEDDYFTSIARMLEWAKDYTISAGVSYEELCNFAETIGLEKGKIIKKSADKNTEIKDKENLLQNIIDAIAEDKCICIEGDTNLCIKDIENMDYKKSSFFAADMLREKYDRIKNDNPYEFIANMLITTLMITDMRKNELVGINTCCQMDEVLKKVWDISEFAQDRFKEGFSSFEEIIKIITFPYTSIDKRCECLVKLLAFEPKNPFYDSESEYCFLNIYVYENWERIKGEFPDITDANMLLYNAYKRLYKYKSSELDLYMEKYEGFYIKNSFRKVILELCQQWFETNTKNEEFAYDSLYDFITYFCNENEVLLFESKLKMTDIFFEYDKFHKSYKSACKGLIKVYKNTKEESIIPLINKCLSELNDDVEITGIAVKELRNIWTKIGAQNGDQEEIRRLYSEYCFSKLLERKEKIKKEKKLDFSEISKTNYQEYAINEAKRDIFVVLGYGRASETFIKSIKNQEECVIYVVPQKNEIIESSVPSYVEIINDGFDSIYKILPVYNLDIEYLEDENAFKEYVKHISKIHLVALGDDKRENVRNVVDFIEVTWQHYVLYEYMVKFCSNVDFKIDFKEVDIVVDAYDYETSYIDSIMNRLDNDFYIKINYVNYRKEVVKELLTEFPLFLADMQEKKLEFKINNPTSRDDTQDSEFVPGETKHNVVLLGDVQKLDEILEVIKGVIRVAGYSVIGNGLGEYSEKNASVYEGKIGENYRLTIISEDSDVIKERLMYEAPDLFECANRTYLHNVEPMFINLNPKGYRFLKLFDEIKKMECIDNQNANKKQLKKEVSDNNPIEKIDLSNIKYLLDEIQKEKQEIISYSKELEVNQFECEVSEILREATYFICMLQDDVASYEIATKIRQACYRIDKSMKHVPIIAALCENGYSDTDYNSFVVGIDEEKPIKYKDPWWRRYDIFSFGSFDKCYSYANLYDNYLSKIAWKMHVTDKEGYDYEKKVRAYYKNHYNFKACEERAITIPYVFYSILCEEMCKDCSLRGFFDGLDNHWSMDVFEKNIDRYIELYKEKVLVKDSNGKYTESFASNAILWLAVLEKNRFNVNLTLDGYTSAINGVENKSLFEEYIHGWKNRDVENSLGSKLHIAKLHGDITTWEFSSGKEYDSRYVRDLGTYLERDVLGNTLMMGDSSKDTTRNEGKTK